MRRLLCVIAMLTLVGFLAPAAHAAPRKHRILLQWPEADTLGQLVMTKHLGNLLDDLGPENVQIEVIAYGMASLAVTTSRPQTLQAAAIADLSKRGVVFHVCHHSMDFLGVKESELLPQVTPVKGAMWYIASKYDEGWEILHP